MPRRPIALLMLLFTSVAWAGAEQTGATSAAPFGAKSAEALPPIPASLAGHWFNTEHNATAGFVIQADKSCELYTERLTSPRSSRGCKVEYYRDNTFLIYLKGTDGQCGSAADFEFRYLKSADASLERLDLDTGGEAHFLLARRLESPATSPVENKTNK